VGSTFWFEVKFENAEADELADSMFRNKLEGVRTLIVAKSASTRNTLHAQVTNWGLHARSADSGDEAIQAMAQSARRGSPYQIVIVDSALAGRGATRLTKAIKADTALSDARVVMLTPVGRHADEAREAGALLCLSKPVRQSVLYNGLLNVVAGHGEHAPAAPETEAVTAPVKRGSRGKLLLAEDNAINQQVALAMLKIEGYDVTVWNNGAEAVAAYTNGEFDLVLMDCHMPEMDGFEATRRIRQIQKQESLRRVPIIALTANAMQQDRAECLKAGMDDHLSKPYTRLQMRAMLDRWLPVEAIEVAAQ
jgi:CheY-like chemotaxis protein